MRFTFNNNTIQSERICITMKCGTRTATKYNGEGLSITFTDADFGGTLTSSVGSYTATCEYSRAIIGTINNNGTVNLNFDRYRLVMKGRLAFLDTRKNGQAVTYPAIGAQIDVIDTTDLDIAMGIDEVYTLSSNIITNTNGDFVKYFKENRTLYNKLPFRTIVDGNDDDANYRFSEINSNIPSRVPTTYTPTLNTIDVGTTYYNLSNKGVRYLTVGDIVSYLNNHYEVGDDDDLGGGFTSIGEIFEYGITHNCVDIIGDMEYGLFVGNTGNISNALPVASDTHYALQFISDGNGIHDDIAIQGVVPYWCLDDEVMNGAMLTKSSLVGIYGDRVSEPIYYPFYYKLTIKNATDTFLNYDIKFNSWPNGFEPFMGSNYVADLDASFVDYYGYEPTMCVLYNEGWFEGDQETTIYIPLKKPCSVFSDKTTTFGSVSFTIKCEEYLIEKTVTIPNGIISYEDVNVNDYTSTWDEYTEYMDDTGLFSGVHRNGSFMIGDLGSVALSLDDTEKVFNYRIHVTDDNQTIISARVSYYDGSNRIGDVPNDVVFSYYQNMASSKTLRYEAYTTDGRSVGGFITCSPNSTASLTVEIPRENVSPTNMLYLKTNISTVFNAMDCYEDSTINLGGTYGLDAFVISNDVEHNVFSETNNGGLITNTSTTDIGIIVSGSSLAEYKSLLNAGQIKYVIETLHHEEDYEDYVISVKLGTFEVTRDIQEYVTESEYNSAAKARITIPCFTHIGDKYQQEITIDFDDFGQLFYNKSPLNDTKTLNYDIRISITHK